MPKMTLSKPELQSTIEELKTQNSEFKKCVSELQSTQQELSGQWKGDANTAFNNAFNSDATQWTAFATLIDQYIAALNTIMTTYDTAEATNTATATTRTYN